MLFIFEKTLDRGPRVDLERVEGDLNSFYPWCSGDRNISILGLSAHVLFRRIMLLQYCNTLWHGTIVDIPVPCNSSLVWG